jgi:RNA polymerase sigma factor (sigma-70 family)
MARPDEHVEIDSLARKCLREEQPGESERLLGQLLFEYCAPLIKSIAIPKLGSSSANSQDVEDVCGDALVQLMGKIEDMRSGAAEAVESFSRYTAVVAYNACHDYFRTKFPQRHRLKSRLRYLLKPERGFDLWESGRGEWICGLREWRMVGGVGTGALAPPPAGAARMSPPDLVRAVFESAGGPVEFDALVDFVADLWGVKDLSVSLDRVEALQADPPGQGAEDAGLDARVHELWKEIGELPRAQRVALLLNLRSDDEKCAMALFSLTGVASMREIAALLEIPAEEFASLWTRLPLDDRSIAERLQVTRQQVINLRKSARRRLERRMLAIGEWNQRRR